MILRKYHLLAMAVTWLVVAPSTRKRFRRWLKQERLMTAMHG
jgi:hypothetical protein